MHLPAFTYMKLDLWFMFTVSLSTWLLAMDMTTRLSVKGKLGWNYRMGKIVYTINKRHIWVEDKSQLYKQTRQWGFWCIIWGELVTGLLGNNDCGKGRETWNSLGNNDCGKGRETWNSLLFVSRDLVVSMVIRKNEKTTLWHHGLGHENGMGIFPI